MERGEIAILSMITREGLTGKRYNLNEDLKEMLERVRQISTRLFEKRMFYKGIASTIALRGMCGWHTHGAARHQGLVVERVSDGFSSE